MLPTPLIDRTLQPGVSLVVFTGPNSILSFYTEVVRGTDISSQVESTDFFDEKLFF